MIIAQNQLGFNTVQYVVLPGDGKYRTIIDSRFNHISLDFHNTVCYTVNSSNFQGAFGHVPSGTPQCDEAGGIGKKAGWSPRHKIMTAILSKNYIDVTQ